MKEFILLAIGILVATGVLLLDAIIDPERELPQWEIVEEESAPVVLPGPSPLHVTVTIYQAVPNQTDSTPHILASGKHINLKRAGSYRYCALSRDLLERWDGPFAYGDTILIEGADGFSGEWIVQDTMNSRFRGRVDLLTDVGTPNAKFESAQLWRIP